MVASRNSAFHSLRVMVGQTASGKPVVAFKIANNRYISSYLFSSSSLSSVVHPRIEIFNLILTTTVCLLVGVGVDTVRDSPDILLLSDHYAWETPYVHK